MNLTPEQNAHKSRIDALYASIGKLEDELTELIGQCRHVFDDGKDEFGHDMAQCLVCGESFGWYCPKSPDHVCHYWSNDGWLVLIDGTEAMVPEGHDSTCESSDSCIFCGQPEERK